MTNYYYYYYYYGVTLQNLSIDTCYQNLLHSSCHIEEAILINSAQIAGVHPALLVDGVVGLVLVPDVAHEDVPAPGDDLAHPVLVRVQDGRLEVRVALAHTPLPHARALESRRHGPSGLAASQQLHDRPDVILIMFRKSFDL